MDKIDPKLTARKVYPLDPIDRSQYYEGQYEQDKDPDPILMPADFMQKVAAGAFASATLAIFIIALLA